MAVTAYTFNSFKRDIMNGAIDLDTDTIKVAFCTSSFAISIDSMTKFSDITNELSVSGNYVAGGFAISGKSVTVDNTNDLAYFDGDDVSVSAATFTFRWIIVYKSTGTSSTSPLICAFDLGADRAYSGDTAVISWATSGILKLT